MYVYMYTLPAQTCLYSKELLESTDAVPWTVLFPGHLLEALHYYLEYYTKKLTSIQQQDHHIRTIMYIICITWLDLVYFPLLGNRALTPCSHTRFAPSSEHILSFSTILLNVSRGLPLHLTCGIQARAIFGGSPASILRNIFMSNPV